MVLRFVCRQAEHYDKQSLTCERFYHEHQTFVSMKSRSWIVQTVGMAIANATYAAARRFATPVARNAFPTLDMYCPS
jgi:hypothetical protein